MSSVAPEFRWQAVGRRKTSVARVYLVPGTGKWSVNGRTIGDYFPRGSLVQHIESEIKHSAGRTVPKAHTVQIDPGSRLGAIVSAGDGHPVTVNSSHHQSADAAGNGLKIVARCPEDGVVEALEGTAPDHFVLAVQWHPERSVGEEPELGDSARAIFRAFVEAARESRE